VTWAREASNHDVQYVICGLETKAIGMLAGLDEAE
jgi:hypothetical protein